MKRLKYFALAALVAFAACEEGNESVIPDPDTGTISGTVTVGGQGLAGVTVTLAPTGATATTAANGDYAFSDVQAGAYTVTISGMPSDAAFPTTSKAAVISTDGQVVDVDFAGNFITTSAISASVSVPGVGGLAGATVAISGRSTASAVTPTSGTVTFSGLRAGNYTVAATLSSADAALYNLDNPSVNVSLAVDELEAVAFTATPKTISSITGRLYIDEATKNNQFDAGNEENLTIADVDVIIEGVSVGVFDTIQTDANGEYELSGLPAANYRITLDTSPFNGAVALGTQNDIVITLGVADTEVVDFGFDIIEQRIDVGAFLGFDEDVGSPSRVNPLAGIDITLYPTQSDAVGATNALDADDTNSSGFAALTFDRADDYAPLGSDTDFIVFADVTAPGAPLTQNGEDIIEIPFPATDSLITADDVFDFLNTAVTVSLRIQEIDEDRYANLQAENATDTTVAGSTDVTNADGLVYFDLTALDEYFFTFDATQPNLPNAAVGLPNWPSPFTLAIDEDAGDAAGSWLSFDHIGTALPNDTLFLGTLNLSWDLVDSRGRMHREVNDRGDIPTWQPATELDFAGPNASTSVRLQQNNNGTWIALGLAQQPDAANGIFQNNGIPSGETFRYVARALNNGRAVLNDTIIEFTPDGSDQRVDLCPLRDQAGSFFATCSTFAMKYQNNTISGTVLYRDGSPAVGVDLRISAADSTIQGRASSIGDTTVTTNGSGAFTTNATVREGFYTITGINELPAAFFNPTTNGAPRTLDVQGSMETETLPDNAGFNATTPATFHVHRTDGVINGVIVNDRDRDENVIDVNEALIGATVTLYADDGLGSVTTSADSIIGTAEIGADGSYSFDELVTRRYIVAAAAPGGEVVIAQGSTAGRYSVTPDNLDIEINTTDPTTLPYWDFETSSIGNPREPSETQNSYFTFLFTDGEVSGTVTNAAGGAAVSAVTVQLVRCANYGTPLPIDPIYGDCTANGGTNASGTFRSTLTASDGTYSFSGLREGVYRVNIVSASGSDADGAFDPAQTTANSLAGTGESVTVFVDGAADLEVVNYSLNN